MSVVIRRGITEGTDDLWSLYERAFSPLRTRAVQRHLMYREEFDALMADDRVIKYIVQDGHGEDDGRPVAMGTLTNQLEAVPLVSPEYFAHHYPQQSATGSLYYCCFVAVDPQHQATGTMGRVIEGMCGQVAPVGGTIVLDIPEFNEQQLRLPTAILRSGRTLVPQAEIRRLDAQVYWAYEFPAPVTIDVTHTELTSTELTSTLTLPAVPDAAPTH